MTKAPMVKIVFPTEASEWHGKSSERMWAQPLSDKLFVLENSPLYFVGVAYKDVVTATGDAGGQLTFSEVVSRGGHSNYQIVLEEGVTREQFQPYWDQIEALGCSYESSMKPENVFAVDVPPEVDVHAVYALLERGEREGIWDFGEGHCQHLVPKGTSN